MPGHDPAVRVSTHAIGGFPAVSRRIDGPQCSRCGAGIATDASPVIRRPYPVVPYTFNQSTCPPRSSTYVVSTSYRLVSSEPTVPEPLDCTNW